MPQFVKDVEQLRRRALNKIEEGAVTQSYKGDVEKTISILNDALATEIVCVLRYMHHYFMATGVHGKSVADEFKEHADSEREHADLIAERIQQLGGKPDFNPKSLLQRSASQYVEGETLAQMIREDLIAERIVIEVYHDMIRHFGDNDPTTRVIIEQILKDEEEHASDLSDLLYITDPQTGETEGQDPGTDPLRLEDRQSAKKSSSTARRPSNGNKRSSNQESRNHSTGDSSEPAWRPGEERQTGSPGTKRHESERAGSPGAPEFSASARGEKLPPRNNDAKRSGATSHDAKRASGKNWKIAKPGKKTA